MHLTMRTRLEPFESEDAESVRNYLNHPGLMGRRYIPWEFSNDLALSKNQVGEILKKWGETERGVWLAIRLQETETAVGHVRASWGWDPLCPGFDLVISPEYQRRGLGSEVLIEIVQWLFEAHPANNVSTWVAEWNKPAVDFLKYHGFTHSGRSRREEYRKGEFVDYLLFDLLRDEWANHD